MSPSGVQSSDFFTKVNNRCSEFFEKNSSATKVALYVLAVITFIAASCSVIIPIVFCATGAITLISLVSWGSVSIGLYWTANWAAHLISRYKLLAEKQKTDPNIRLKDISVMEKLKKDNVTVIKIAYIALFLFSMVVLFFSVALMIRGLVSLSDKWTIATAFLASSWTAAQSWLKYWDTKKGGEYSSLNDDKIIKKKLNSENFTHFTKVLFVAIFIFTFSLFAVFVSYATGNFLAGNIVLSQLFWQARTIYSLLRCGISVAADIDNRYEAVST